MEPFRLKFSRPFVICVVRTLPFVLFSRPFLIGELGYYPDFRFRNPSGLAFSRPFLICEIGILPDWYKRDPFGLAFSRLYFTCENGFLPDCPDGDPSGFAFLRIFLICVIRILPFVLFSRLFRTGTSGWPVLRHLRFGKIGNLNESRSRENSGLAKYGPFPICSKGTFLYLHF